MLDLRAALDLFDSGKWVSLAFVCADKTKGTYGKIVRLPRCRKLTRSANGMSSSKKEPYAHNASKNPNHDEHFTRNVLLPNGSKRKFHFRLLFAINGQKLV